MKKILPLLACVSLLTASGCGASRHSAQSSDDDGSSSNFTISYVGTGSGESVLVSVTCTVSSTDAAEGAVSRDAVLGLMYKGCAATSRSPEVSPLIKMGTSLTSEQSAWISSLLSSGDYKKYIVNVAKDNMQIAKIKKSRNYSVTATVAVDRRHLRRALEEQGIIRRLGISE